MIKDCLGFWGCVNHFIGINYFYSLNFYDDLWTGLALYLGLVASWIASGYSQN